MPSPTKKEQINALTEQVERQRSNGIIFGLCMFLLGYLLGIPTQKEK